MILRDGQQAAGRLRHRDVQRVDHPAHARAADDVFAVAGGTAGGVHELLQGDADRNAERNGILHRTADCDILLRDLLAVERGGNVCERTDVADNGADIQRQTAGRDDTPRDLVDDLLLIARRIIALQQMQLHIVRVLQHLLQRGNGSVVMLLQADDRALRTGEFLHGADAAHDIGCEILHDLLVDPQQRLTLVSVCKDEFGLAVDLYMGGKARAARTENTGVADQFIQLHPVRLR